MFKNYFKGKEGSCIRLLQFSTKGGRRQKEAEQDTLSETLPELYPKPALDLTYRSGMQAPAGLCPQSLWHHTMPASATLVALSGTLRWRVQTSLRNLQLPHPEEH